MTEFDRRRFLQAMLAGLGAVVLGSCGGGRSQGAGLQRAPRLKTESGQLLPPDQLPPTERPTLRMPGQGFGLLTPFGYNLPPAYFYMIYLYDTLLWTDSTGAILPWLAAALPERSADGLTYVFELRDGVRFHDGRPLTAADVEFTFNYFAAQKDRMSPFVLFKPEHVESVRATGPRRVEFRLDKPAVTFPEAVAGRVPIVPKHLWSSVTDPGTQDPKLVVGSGPYRLESQQGSSYAFVANDDFFLGRSFVARIETRDVADPLQALLADDLDVASLDQPSSTVLRRLQDAPDYGMVTGPPDFLFALHWRLDKPGPMGDVQFRRACALAIDRQNIVRRVTAGNAEVGNPGFLPKGHPFRVEVEQYAYDPAGAARLLDKAGYRKGSKGVRTTPDGKPLRLRLNTLPSVRATQLVADSLNEAGIGIEIVLGEESDMAVMAYGGHQGDPDYMRSVYSSRANALPWSAKGYKNEEFDDLADRQLVTLDEAERKRLVARMQEIVAADLPLLHLYYPAPAFVHRKSVLDQVAIRRNGVGPLNKQALLTGVAVGGTEVRPTK